LYVRDRIVLASSFLSLRKGGIVRGFERDLAGIGALADPVRRRLYLYVCSRPGPVGRDEAAAATGTARHQAKFHLDRLEADGLLETEFARLGGRSGPGAGRTSKLYRRAPRDIAVSLPDREYELAGRLLADAVAGSVAAGEPVLDVLHRLATEHGRSLGAAAAAGRRPDSAASALRLAVAVLAEHAYEPRAEGDRVVLANCPFHELAQAQTDLVCNMNRALIDGVAQALEPHRPRVALDPRPARCCVVLEAGTA
jgi:predicted ArsR family transcriptional regulator